MPNVSQLTRPAFQKSMNSALKIQLHFILFYINLGWPQMLPDLWKVEVLRLSFVLSPL